MNDEQTLRLGCFIAVLLLMTLGEMLWPRRRASAHKPLRWGNNLALVSINTVLARLVLPLGAVGVALVAEERSWGLLPSLSLPAWIGVPLGVVLLDLAIYVQHVVFHATPWLWRLHMVHHADLDVDVTTGLRFHTLEILLSLGIKVAVVVMLGVPALAVLIFEILLNATSMFSHGNLRLPHRLDRFLRLLLVTPDMHRVHHSIQRHETNSNYGFNLPWWDYLFGTYRAQPSAGHDAMTTGLEFLRDEQRVERLPGMLALPFTAQMPEMISRDALSGSVPLARRS